MCDNNESNGTHGETRGCNVYGSKGIPLEHACPSGNPSVLILFADDSTAIVKWKTYMNLVNKNNFCDLIMNLFSIQETLTHSLLELNVYKEIEFICKIRGVGP
jgi:hypothetical protein